MAGAPVVAPVVAPGHCAGAGRPHLLAGTRDTDRKAKRGITSMVDIRDLDDGIAAADQLVESDFAEIAARGFKTIINNRPDGEAPGQLTAAAAAALAEKHGLAYRYLPMTVATLTPETVQTFRQYLEEETGPLLVHCRTGTRSTVLWAMAEAGRGRLTVEDVVTKAADAGYDVTGHAPILFEIAGGR